MFRVFIVTQSTPGLITLLADPEEWQRVAEHIRTLRGAVRQAYRLISPVTRMTGSAVLITFPEEQGRALLSALKLAS